MISAEIGAQTSRSYGMYVAKRSEPSVTTNEGACERKLLLRVHRQRAQRDGRDSQRHDQRVHAEDRDADPVDEADAEADCECDQDRGDGAVARRSSRS